jgi:hypothetical protein
MRFLTVARGKKLLEIEGGVTGQFDGCGVYCDTRNSVELRSLLAHALLLRMSLKSDNVLVKGEGSVDACYGEIYPADAFVLGGRGLLSK